MKKITKRDIFLITIGVIIGSLTIVLADTITASLVIYDNDTSNSRATDVQSAIDDLYDGFYNLAATAGGGVQLVISKPVGISNTLIDELYRYQGTTVNNYICFGTTDKDTCIGTELVGTENEADRYDKYMYRIIGVNSSGQMKLIKKEALNTAYKWDTSTGTKWPNSALKAGLNGSYFLTNTTYVPSGWEDRIATTDWHYPTTTSISEGAIGSSELAAATTPAKIGLIYLHDYADAYSSTPQYNKSSWIFLFQTQNDSSAPNTDYEWTITRYDSNYPYGVRNNGNWDNNRYMTYSQSVRPVFYLASSQVIASGSGTLADPYILA